jgi:hypothetical protein
LLRTKSGGKKTKHLLHLLCSVLLISTEDIRFSTFSISKFVYVGLFQISQTPTLSTTPDLLHTMVPYVISPTRACGGSKLKLMINESFSAFKESSSWHVSTTNKKIGGAGAGRASLYSIVEYPGESSSGHAFGPISL